MRLISCLLLFKDILLCMQEHNPSLIRIIVAVNSRKLERTDDIQEICWLREGSDEMPMVLFRSGSLYIRYQPPNMHIIIDNSKAIWVKVRLHALNKLLKIPFECTSDCFLAA